MTSPRLGAPVGLVLVLYATSTLLAAGPAPQDAIPMTKKLRPQGQALGGEFGYTVAVSGNTVVIGDPRDNVSDALSGTAYLIDATTGAELHQLDPLDGGLNEEFGYSVAIAGDVVLVGAWHDEDNGTRSGSAYLFDVATGARLHKLLPNDGVSLDLFGSSVATDGVLAVVGSPEDDDNGGQSGSAYVFDVATGAQLMKLLPSDGSGGDKFGIDVGMSGNVAIIGAYFDDDGASEAGSAYLFDLTTGAQLMKLLAPDGELADQFGFAVVIDGDTAVVGAPGHDGPASDAGKAYVFDVPSGQLRFELTASEPGALYGFGSSVAIDGRVAMIDAPRDSFTGGGDGCSYLFDLTTGVQLARLVRKDGSGDGAHRNAVGLSGGRAVATAVCRYTWGDSSAVYLLDTVPSVGFRNAGTNPDSFRAGAAMLGADLSFTVDPTTTGHTHALVLAFDTAGDFPLGGGQRLLAIDLGGSGAIIATPLVEGPRVGIDVPVPNLAFLAGFELHAQALHALGVAPFALSNSQDIVIGGCAQAQTWLYELHASDGSLADRLGVSLAVDAGRILAGSQDDSQGLRTGAAYLFDAATGAELLKLVADDAMTEDLLGSGVALTGNIAVVGARNANATGAGYTGAVYLFDATTGAQIDKLLSDDIGNGHHLGTSVAAQGNLALVGAPGNQAAYVFDLTTGDQLFELTPTGAPAGDFGESVALDGNLAVVGAPRFSMVGRAFLFDVTTGTQLAILEQSDPSGGDLFGQSVAIDGTTVLVGAPQTDDRGLNSGAAYLYDVSVPMATMTESSKLTSPDAAQFDLFGMAVALDGNTAIVGQGDEGVVLLFDVTTGLEVDRLTPGCDGAAYGSFGGAVATDGSHIAVGAQRDDDGDAHTGSVFLF